MGIVSKIIIREATVKDIPVLLRFEQGVIDAERAFDTTLKENTTYYDLEQQIAAANVRLAVAEHNGVVIASGYARIQDSKEFLQHNQHAYLGFMYVDPEYRGQSINSKIIDDLKRWLQSKAIDELWLEVYVDNAPAIKAYEKTGFSKHLVTMRMSLQDEETAQHHKKSFESFSTADCSILILGSLPGDKSLELSQYYGHARNRFWKVIATITGSALPTNYEDKKTLLLSNKIALWDVACSANRKGSLDSAIENVVPNDLDDFIARHKKLKTIGFNGLKAQALYDKYFKRNKTIRYIVLPSTSPANAGISFEKICVLWKQIME